MTPEAVNPPALGLASLLRFGKYKGLTVGAVLRFNPFYLWWAHKNLDRVMFDDATLSAIKAECRKDQAASLDRQNAWAWGFGAGAKRSRDRLAHRRIEIEHEERRKAGFVSDYNPHTGKFSWVSARTGGGE